VGVVTAGNLLILEPEKWVGKALPILPYLEEHRSQKTGDRRHEEEGNAKFRMQTSTSSVGPNAEIGSEIERGRWVVVIYSKECEHCREMVPELVRRSQKTGHGSDEATERRSDAGRRWCFVEMPPYAGEGEALVPISDRYLSLRLSGQHEWFASTPVVIWLEDGKVAKVKESAQLSDMVKEPL
jgi:hypothetical protein